MECQRHQVVKKRDWGGARYWLKAEDDARTKTQNYIEEEDGEKGEAYLPGLGH